MALQPYINNEEFTPKKIESASKACTAMCQWVHAMNKYHFVAKEVEPKRIALKESEEELASLNANLAKLRLPFGCRSGSFPIRPPRPVPIRARS